MGFLNRYFRGDAVSDADYAAREADEPQEDKPPERTYTRKPQAAASTPRKDNVVEFPRAKPVSADTGGFKTPPAFPREPSGFTRESAGFTREFDASGSMLGGGFSGGGTRSGQTETGEAYVVFKRLKDFQMGSQVADKMVEGKIVILNLESCDDEIARRVLDFIGGVAYACSSMVKRIAGRVFMITPKGVNSDGEFFDELRNNDPGIKYDD